jgi:glycosyltransferase involved in cell wall biosynthesis
VDIPEVNKNDDLSKYDVVHFTVFRPFFISLPFTKPKNTKFVLTIHDMHPFVYPDHFPSGIKGGIKFLLNKFLVRTLVDAIITISETSKKDICRFLGFDPQKVHVIYLAPKEAHKPIKKGDWGNEITKKYGLPKNFVFYLGDINYNKNIPTLVKACQKANITLVMAGKQISEIDNVNLNHPENAHLKDVDFSKVIKPGFITDDEANQMMNLAICTVQPSFYEGFGLSVIHAFASGCPVISSRTQALVEVGGDACIYFDPKDVDELVKKINDFVNNESLRKEYIKKGFERVKKFSWQKTATETLDVYATV